MTGLEPATSRPPAVRATNCATSRKHKNPEKYATLTFPAYMQGGSSHAASTEAPNVENPLSMMLGKSITPHSLWAYFIILSLLKRFQR